MSTTTTLERRPPVRQALDSVVVRFAGDSGDGIQVTGSQFTQTTALQGNDLATFPDFPAEIRAPAGTTFGVSAFQINFGAGRIMTPGDEPDVLVALNPAALKVNLSALRPGGTIITDTGSYTERNLRKAGYEANPLEDGSLGKYRLLAIDISKMTLEAVKGAGLTQKESLRCKNMWTLGLVYWLYDRDRQPTIDWVNHRFAKRTEIAKANVDALNAGHAYGETIEIEGTVQAYSVPAARLEPGVYRNVTGAEALAWGLIAGAKLAGLKMFLGSYPITPASSLLHILSGLKQYGVLTFQAEDEIAAVASAIGASYAGALGVTSSSGPGVALKTEALGLAISVELPLVVVNSQRAGPSTGMPTKTEQSDLYQAVYGRNADSPLAVVAARSPSDCFAVGVEAVRIATTYMTPVILLTDGYIANAAEPWRIPDVDKLTPAPVRFHAEPKGFHPFLRDSKTLARVWAIPGTPDLEHRVGGIEKDYDSGNISYDPANHQKMTAVRHDKIARIADSYGPLEIACGERTGKLALVGWGSTYGAIGNAAERLRAKGFAVSHVHLRHIWPLPRDLGAVLAGFEKVLVPEMNTGQLLTVLRDRLLIPAQGLNKVTGQPFKIAEIEAAAQRLMES